MLSIKDFKFKNVKDLDFATAPICECGCGSRVSIVSNKNEITQIAVNILGGFECPSCVGLIIHKSKTCEVISPCDDNKFQVSVAPLKSVLSTFNKYVEDMGYHHLVILQQVDEDSYKIISPQK